MWGEGGRGHFSQCCNSIVLIVLIPSSRLVCSVFITRTSTLHWQLPHLKRLRPQGLNANYFVVFMDLDSQLNVAKIVHMHSQQPINIAIIKSRTFHVV